MNKIVPFLFLLLVACDQSPEAPPCEVCSGEVVESFDSRYFLVVPNRDAQPVLADYDSATAQTTAFAFCPNAIQEEASAILEFYQWVKASGHFKHSCENDTLQLIDLSDFEIIYTCPPPIPQLSGDFSIFRHWQVQWLQTEDTLLYPPCEGPAYLTFVEDEPLHFDGSTGQNGISGNFSLEENQVLHIADYVQTLVVGTRQQMVFEQLFVTIFPRNGSLEYTLENNFLTLANRENQSSIRLFTTGEGP